MLTQARKSLSEAGILLKFCVARYMKLVVGELDKGFMLAHAYM